MQFALLTELYNIISHTVTPTAAPFSPLKEHKSVSASARSCVSLQQKYALPNALQRDDGMGSVG